MTNFANLQSYLTLQLISLPESKQQNQSW